TLAEGGTRDAETLLPVPLPRPEIVGGEPQRRHRGDRLDLMQRARRVGPPRGIVSADPRVEPGALAHAQAAGGVPVAGVEADQQPAESPPPQPEEIPHQT